MVGGYGISNEIDSVVNRCDVLTFGLIEQSCLIESKTMFYVYKNLIKIKFWE